MANYYVGPDADYANVQAAIDALYTAVGSTAFSEAHSIIITNGAVYDGYTVASLTPTLTYRLFITAATSSKPIILAKSGNTALLAPVQISSPYVELSRQELRGGPFGLIADSGAGGINCKQIMVRDPWRIGMLFDGAADVLVHNCVVYAPNTCVVGKNITSFNIAACTMKNGMNSLKRESVNIPENIPDPYPAASVISLDKATSDTEDINIRGNNLVAINGPVFATNAKTAAYFVSDYNNLYSPQSQVAHFLPLYGKKAMTLAQWRTATSQDGNSISEDPRFYQGVVKADLEDGLYQDLKLRPASLLRAKATELDDDTWPAHVTSADMTGDFLDAERTTPKFTMGAYELSGSVWNYWDRIFPMAGADPHGDTEGILEAASAHYASVVKPWYPKMKTGFFWARDHQYYLYSSKGSATLNNMRWYQFDFTGEVIDGTVTAWLDAEELTSTQWNIHGQTIIMRAVDLTVTGDAQVFSISGEQLVWDTGELAYTTGDYEWSSAIGDGTRFLVMDPAPEGGAPIVVTDTSITPDTDTGELPYGFVIDYNDDLEVVTMEFQSGKLPSDLTVVTVEWETSNTGIYEATTLSMNPIHNPKTDGFLCIPNLPATQWDRTLNSGECTLQDDWTAARTGDELPWARVSGKNKWAPLTCRSTDA